MSDRMDAPRCRAIAKSTGERCKRRPHPGASVCVKHGAGARQVRAAAERRVEEEQHLEIAREAVRRFALAEDEQVPEDLDPRAVLLEELFRSVRLVRSLDVEVNTLAAIHGPTFHATGRATGEAKPHVVYVMWTEARSHLKAVAVECQRAGVEAFRASIEAFEAHLMAEMLRAVFNDPAIGLSPEQRETALKVTGEHLRALDSGGDVDG